LGRPRIGAGFFVAQIFDERGQNGGGGSLFSVGGKTAYAER